MKHIFTAIGNHLNVLNDHLTKVKDYFLAKTEEVRVLPMLSKKSIDEKEDKFVKPLFSDMNHPS